jgi:hypothetical protein
MKKKEIKAIDQEVVTDVICDSCGKSCLTEYGPEYMTLQANWGFMSNHDLETWEAHVCGECVDSKFSFISFDKKSSWTGAPLPNDK